MKFRFLLIVFAVMLSLVVGCSDIVEGIDENNTDNDDRKVIDEFDTTEPSEEPPTLMIYVGGEKVKPILGSHNWMIELEDNLFRETYVTSLPPPELVKNSKLLHIDFD